MIDVDQLRREKARKEAQGDSSEDYDPLQDYCGKCGSEECFEKAQRCESDRKVQRMADLISWLTHQCEARDITILNFTKEIAKTHEGYSLRAQQHYEKMCEARERNNRPPKTGIPPHLPENFLPQTPNETRSRFEVRQHLKSFERVLSSHLGSFGTKLG